jgi:RNA polymerase sigma factor (sigma-70 family)
MIETMDLLERTDAQLVAQCLAGDRDAFRAIVERYQTLVCSIAYNGTGNVARSEDIAQETFITAWGSLRSLREPEKLRAWLGGITRQHLRRHWRDRGREPTSNAAELDLAAAPASGEASPSDRTITAEEQALLWRCLAQLPDVYREPLILYYREHESVEHVAATLELSEDAVKQRLARGRKLLADEMLGFVATGLQRTAPTRAFTLNVLMLLTGTVGPAAVATTALSTPGAVAKTSWLATVLLPVAPFLGIGAGMSAQWLLIRDLSSNRRSRIRRTMGMVIGWVGFMAAAAFGEQGVHAWANAKHWDDRHRFLTEIVYWWLFLTIMVTLQFVGLSRRSNRGSTVAERADAPPPMKAGTLTATAIGLHAMFAWLPALAWKMGDRLGAGLIVAGLLALSARALWRFRGLTPDRLGPVMSEQVAWIGALILFVLNARVEVWVSLRYHVPLAEVAEVLPTYWVPILTGVFVAWVLAMVAIGRRLARKQQAIQRDADERGLI